MAADGQGKRVVGGAVLATTLTVLTAGTSVAAVPDHVNGQPITVFINKDGGRIVTGTDNPRDQDDVYGAIAAHSDLVTDDLIIDPLDIPSAQWAVTMACIRQRVATFNIVVVDENPGNVTHQEVFVGGEPAMFDLHFAAGVAPAALDCSVFVDGVAFVFGDTFWFRPTEPNGTWRTTDLCETIVHEAGHMWGLDHVLEATDIMSYLSHDDDRAFQDTTATCGRYEDEPENCGAIVGACGPTQNSYAMLIERFGQRVDPGQGDPGQGDPGQGDPGDPHDPGEGTDGANSGKRGGGCHVGGGQSPGGLALAMTGMLGLWLARRRRAA